MGKPILCLDFDGVIHSYASGWKGAGVIPDPPVEGSLQFLERAQADFRVAIYSTRSKSFRGRWAMKRWLAVWAERTWGQGFETDDFLCSIEWPWFKPPALVTIDDRAITFTGTFPDAETLLAFRPWNKPRPADARQPSASRFRKKPVVIEAVQFRGDVGASEIMALDLGCGHDPGRGCDYLSIATLEGDMRAYPGDWIIRGVKGELYPCKPEIFEATYQPAEDGS